MAQLFVFGTLRRATGFPSKNLNAAYSLELQEGWTLEAGDQSGQSAFDTPESGQFEGFVFELPFSFQLKAQTMAAWPRIRIQLSYLDAKGLKQLAGEADVFVPMQEGRTCLKVECFAPTGPGGRNQSSSIVYDQKGQTGGDRALLVTEGAGMVEVVLETRHSGFQERGIIF